MSTTTAITIGSQVEKWNFQRKVLVFDDARIQRLWAKDIGGICDFLTEIGVIDYK